MSDDGNQNLNAEPQPTHRSEAHYENSKELHTIYIKNLSDATRAKDLGVLFEKFGKLIRCDVPEPRPEQSPYAFVEYELSSDANKAFNEMQGVEVQDHKLELAWARRRSGRPAFRGRYPPRGSYRGRFDRGGFRGPSGFRGRYSSPYSRGGPPSHYDRPHFERPDYSRNDRPEYTRQEPPREYTRRDDNRHFENHPQ